MKLTFVRSALVALLSMILLSCVSGYSSYYTPTLNNTDIATKRVSPPPATPILERSAPADYETVLTSYARRGYQMIGYSMFNSGRDESEESALKQGSNVGADLVLVLNPQYTGSITSSMPFTTPTTETSKTSGSATVHGPDGTFKVYGKATTTTYGSKTTYFPITMNRSDYGAIYLVKMRMSLGVSLRDLNDAERHEMQTNQGAVVTVVVDDTPAFMADILTDDVITAIDGVVVPNGEGLLRIVGEKNGKTVTMTISRRGKLIEKSVQLND